MSALACREAVERLPWMANDSLAGEERVLLEAHLEGCPSCRRELARCLAERTALRAERPPAPSPHPAQLERLFQRIDAGEADADDAEDGPPARRSPTRVGLLRRTPRPIRWVLAAQLVALAGLGYLAARPAVPPATAFRALSDPVGTPRHATLRVVFAAEATEAEVRAILMAANLEIVAGPTPVGAYGLASRPGGDSHGALAMLRADPRVRFAEPVAGAAEVDAPQR